MKSRQRLPQSVTVLVLLILTGLLFIGCQSKELTAAKMYMQRNDWDRALEQLELAVETYPDDAEVRYLLGHAYGMHERLEDMIEQLDISWRLSDEFHQQITALREHYWIQKYTSGITAQDEQNYEKAEADLKLAIKLVPTKYEAYKKLAINYLKTEQPAQARAIYERLLKQNPDDLELLISTANLYYSQGELDRAIAILQQVLEMEPAHPDALANLALAYDAQEKIDKAEAAFNRAVAANPQDKDLLFLFAVHHYKRDNYERAIQLFERVLELKPDDFEALANIGNAYLSMAEDLRLQLKSTNSILAEDSDEVLKLKNNIIAHYKKAIPFMEKALALKPDNPNLWQNLGIAYVNTGQIKKGEDAFLKAEELKARLSDSKDEESH